MGVVLQSGRLSRRIGKNRAVLHCPAKSNSGLVLRNLKGLLLLG